MRKPEITVTEKTLATRSELPLSKETSRLKVAAMQQAVEAAAADPTPEKPAQEVPKIAQPAHTETDKELSSMLEERETNLNRRKKRASVVANVALLLLVVTPVTVVAVTPSLRAKFEKVVFHLKESKNDFNTIANTKGTFDEALENVAVHGDHINAATEALGVDPNSVGADEDLGMTAELTQLMGEEAEGFQARRGKLENLGTITRKVTGIADEGAQPTQ
ncbi:hypothetical protein Hhel01_00397 [Haloferula helveola]